MNVEEISDSNVSNSRGFSRGLGEVGACSAVDTVLEV
jgi:hypothetical protein